MDMVDPPRQRVRGTDDQDPGQFGVGRLFWLTSDAIVAADITTGTIVLWNPAAARLFGYEAEEAIGMPLEKLVPSQLAGRHVAGVDRYRHGAKPALVGGPPVDVPAVTKNGHVVDVGLTLTDVSVSHDRGDRRFVLALIRDMTAIRTSERELQAAMDAMEEFVATASHDLRSPLTSVMGFAQALLEGDDRDSAEDRRRFVEAIARGAAQASRLVEDLLTLSQIQGGALPLDPCDVSVAAALREALERSGVEATYPSDTGLVVRADPHHLERILINYLTNASRYGADPITVTARVDGPMVDIAVRDSGAGVPADFVPRLFARFAQADSSKRRGTGLGLSIVRGLAQANGGEAYYRAPPEGPAFGVYLPDRTAAT